MPTVGAIVLAAGFSRRFGSVKLNARLPGGHSVLEQSLLKLQASAVSDIIVAGRQELAALGCYDCMLQLRKPCRLVITEHSELGMGHSLAEAAKVIPEHWGAALVCLADMPYINPQTVDKLIKHSRSDRIIVPVYQEHRGHPVCFGADFFLEIANSQGDSGARHVLGRHVTRTETLEVDDPGIIKDIDRPGDLE
ncbi:nucleotidyltransferase family protein [Pseudohongiella spirulinae]|uniref:Molybdopterin-guanine dinucleotide biosynthesis protein MobA n=1 Tax=Pseudohongiella spirulinae TaxID=1249552 RepID=A0A0S2KCQ0_9GAMM|nr:nucleotidyltransferase family protein [Pseudohongiella spirulinae]ALO46025.1 Molybdopterin-guanine dinucleotide biosynthesis protein MobA [Pseudohongiella spirulinae]